MPMTACPGINGECLGPRRSGRVGKVSNNEPGSLCEECESAVDNGMNSDTRPCTGAKYIFNHVLGYIVSVRNCSRKNDIVHLVASFFSAPVIDGAKKELWDNCPVDVVGAFTRRKTTDERSSREANVEDMIDALRKLEDAAVMPEFAVPAEKLDLIPKVKPGELLDYSIAERLSRLEAKFSGLSDTVISLSNENAQLKDAFEKSTSPICHVEVTSPIPVGLPPVLPIISHAAVVAGQNTGIKPKTSSNISPSSQPANSETGDTEFVLPNEQQKRIDRSNNRRRRPPKVFTGGGEDFKSLVGTEPNRDIYVYRVSKNASMDDLKDFATSKANLDVRYISKISDESWDSQSFKISIPASQLDTGLNAQWPAGICVRRFFSPRAKRVDNDK